MIWRNVFKGEKFTDRQMDWRTDRQTDDTQPVIRKAHVNLLDLFMWAKNKTKRKQGYISKKEWVAEKVWERKKKT